MKFSNLLPDVEQARRAPEVRVFIRTYHPIRALDLWRKAPYYVQL